MFTHFNSKNEPDQLSIVPIDQVVEKITSDSELEQHCSVIRSLTKEQKRTGDLDIWNKKEQEKAKLPAFIPAGEFSSRNSNSHTKYWGRIVLNINNLTDPEYLKNKLISEKDPTILLMFVSPSGNGLKVIHQLDYPDLKSHEDISHFHKQAFRALLAYYY